MDTANRAQRLLDRYPLLFFKHSDDDDDCRFIARHEDYSLYFSADHITAAFMKEADGSRELTAPRLVFEKCNPDVCAVAGEKSNTTFKFFRDDKSSWRAEQSTYKSIVYPQLYKGVSLKICGSADALKLCWEAECLRDLKRVRLKLEDAEQVEKAGEHVLVKHAFGTIIIQAAKLSQTVLGKAEKKGRCGYEIVGENLVLLDARGRFFKSKPFKVIMPVTFK